MYDRRRFLEAATAVAGFSTLARPFVAKGEDLAPVAKAPNMTVARVPDDRPLRVGALIFPRMDQIDLTGPYAVLCRMPNTSVKLLWKDTNVVRDHKGLGLVPDATLADAGDLDVLLVPGGPGQEALMEDEAVLSFIRTHAATAKCLFSVCTGSLICGAAGLLKGRRATTHWASIHLLKYFGAETANERVVIDGTLVSAAGLTAGIDGALTVASLLRGEEAAKTIQLDIQYAPEPPFDTGLPDKAPTEMVERLTKASETLRAKRLATARRVAVRLGVQIDD